MTSQQVYDDLTPIFRDIFDDDTIQLSAEMSAKDVDAWDSLNHIRLIVAVERSMGIKFNLSEIGALENVGQFVDLIQGKLES